MEIESTHLPGVKLIYPKVFRDDRGFFLETYRQPAYEEMGLDLPFMQDNTSHSSRGVLRGLHYQLQHPQGKLVWVTSGEIVDVALDIRKGSPTFGQWFMQKLCANPLTQLYIPPGFAHGFCVLSQSATFHYKCTDIYHPQSEFSILWNDPDLDIPWPIERPLLSDKDKRGTCLAKMPEANLPVYTG